MNLSLVTSFIVAGVLMLGILSLNSRMAESSAKLTLRYVIEERAQAIEMTLNNDIPKIGNDIYTRTASPIRDARQDMIKFKSNLDNSGAVETVIWEYTENVVDGSSNPDDHTLYREVDGDRITFSSGVTNFKIIYLDAQRDTLSYSNITASGEDSDIDEEDGDGNQSNRDKISYISISLTVETQELIGGAGAGNATYLKTNWKKTFPVYNQIN